MTEYMGIQIESSWCFVEICINVKLIYESHTHTSNDKVKNQLNYASLTHKNDNNSSNSSGGINFPKQLKVTSAGAKMKVNL